MKTKQFLVNSMLACGLLMGASASVMAEPNATLWPVMKEAFFEKRPMKDVTFMKIEAPRRAESGA